MSTTSSGSAGRVPTLEGPSSSGTSTNDTRLGPEEAGDYMQKMNFRGIVEYLSAEVIVSRPEDPVLFIRDLLDNRIAERHGTGFEPSQVSEYLHGIYSEVEEHADEYGRISNKPVKAVTVNAAEEIEKLASRVKKSELVLAGMRDILSKLDSAGSVGAVLANSAKLTGADRAVMYIYEEATKELVLIGGDDGVPCPEIRMPKTRGLAGGVATTGTLVNIKDAFTDPIFDRTYDVKAGYKTNSLLAVPIKAKGDGALVGVLQVLNKKHGIFGPLDEEFLVTLATLVGPVLSSVKQQEQSLESIAKLHATLAALPSLQSQGATTNSLISLLTAHLPRIVGADHCTIYMADPFDKEVYRLEDGDNRLPFGMGIVGTVAATGETINLPDPYKDPRFNKEEDQRKGLTTRNLLCMPITSEGHAIAVVYLTNKVPGSFGKDDEEILGSFLHVVSPMIRATQIYQSSSSGSSIATSSYSMGGQQQPPPSRDLPPSATKRQQQEEGKGTAPGGGEAEEEDDD